MDASRTSRAAGWTNGEPLVLLIILRQPGANIIETIDRVKALLPALAASISPAIDVEVASTGRRPSAPRSQDVERTLLISVGPAWCWWSSSSCAAAGHRSSRASRCRSRSSARSA